MNAIANILREAADKIAAVCALDAIIEQDSRGMESVPLTTAPALPDPPEGFHKAMMGPLKVQAEKPTSDILMWQDGIWKDLRWNGNSTIPYALRIGSEIARLNGLEPEAIPADKEPDPFVFDWSLVPEGRVPAMDSDGQWHHYWTTPSPSSGRKPQWVVASSDQVRDSDRFTKFNHPPFPGDWKDSLQVRPKPEPAKRREWDASVCRADGEIFQRDDNDDPKRWEYVHVREVLPGDPTMEQVEELVKAAKLVVTTDRSYNSGQIPALRKALQPFTGKESK